MGYVAVSGGSEAILKAEELVAYFRLKEIPLRLRLARLKNSSGWR